MGWEMLKETTTEKSVQWYLAEAKKQAAAGVDTGSLIVTIAGVGITLLTSYFTKSMAPVVANALRDAGVGLAVAGLINLYLKDPDAAQLARVTQACAEENGSYIITNAQYWIYNSANGNVSTTEIRNKYSFRK